MAQVYTTLPRSHFFTAHAAHDVSKTHNVSTEKEADQKVRYRVPVKLGIVMLRTEPRFLAPGSGS